MTADSLRDKHALRLAAAALLRRVSESTYECTVCERKFHAYDLPHYSLANEGTRLINQNRGRAMAHTRAHARRGEK